MKVVYIAGPYCAQTAWEVEQNVRNAECWALAVAQAGAVPLCPHTMNRYFFGAAGLSDEGFWLPGMLELVGRCDGLLLIPGWEASAGARGERDRAVKLELPILPLGRVAVPRVSPMLVGWIAGIEGA